MATCKVDTLDFHFQPNFEVSKYDDWEYHKSLVGKSAVDVVAFRKTKPPRDCWLIEAKDFRNIRGTPGDKNISDLATKTANKANDTWDGLKAAAVKAANSAEKHFAQLAVQALKVSVVLHLEPYAGKTKVFKGNPNPANVQQKLKQLVRSLDPNPLVVSISTTPKHGLPWSVT